MVEKSSSYLRIVVVVLCVAKEDTAMHDYMKALYHRFDSTTEQIERLEEETDRIYKKLVNS